MAPNLLLYSCSLAPNADAFDGKMHAVRRWRIVGASTDLREISDE